MTATRDAVGVITVTKLRTLHPWVRVGVVVTGITPEGDGPLVAFRPYAEHMLYR